MKIMFLHGWHSVPGGVKPSYLAKHGHEIVNPALDDDDFDQAVRTAQAEYSGQRPDVIVGSSRGGAVAMNIDTGTTPLVLLCPAWKRWGSVKKARPGTVVLHSEADDVIPFADSRELMRVSGLPESALIVVSNDHRLADPKPMQTMLFACEFACLPKNWYSIYQWGPTARDGYTELVASLITAWLDQIGLGVSGLRQKKFRVADHRGQATLRTDIGQFTEKRFCRALFNLEQVSGLGRVIATMRCRSKPLGVRSTATSTCCAPREPASSSSRPRSPHRRSRCSGRSSKPSRTQPSWPRSEVLSSRTTAFALKLPLVPAVTHLQDWLLRAGRSSISGGILDSEP